jgi:hypothetical protein
MNNEYVDPSVFNKQTQDNVDFSSYLNEVGGNVAAEDGLSWNLDFDINGFQPTPPALQSYQSSGAAAQQQLMNSIPAADVSDVNYTSQLGTQFDAGNSFPFPLQGAPQNVGTPNTAPSTSRSPESSPQYRDSPFSNNTTSPEANPQPPQSGPKKRGRKPKIIKNEAEAAQMRQRFLERNRLAASKCRDKKKEWTNNMQQKVHDLKEHNTHLRFELAELQRQIEGLREIFQPHLEAGCHNGPTVPAALGRRDKKLAVRRKASMNEPMDLDSMSYETESNEVKTKETRKISVDSGVADLSTPTQPAPAQSFSP